MKSTILFSAVRQTRSVRQVPNSATVPRLGLRPGLLLDVAALDTQRTLLDTATALAVAIASSFVAVWRSSWLNATCAIDLNAHTADERRLVAGQIQHGIGHIHRGGETA